MKRLKKNVDPSTYTKKGPGRKHKQGKGALRANHNGKPVTRNRRSTCP